MPVALSEPNSKLGSIWNFSIPAVTACPGATEACLKSCYARRGNYIFPAIQNFFLRNYEGTKEAGFVNEMADLILKKGCRVFRIHGAGDFYDATYIRNWIKVITRVNDRLARTGEYCRFYFYTRSWRVKKLLPAVRELSRLPHVHAWLSTDRTSGAPPEGQMGSGGLYVGQRRRI